MKKLTKIIVTFTLVIAFVILALPTDSVFAQDTTPPTKGTNPRRQQKDLSDVFEELIDRYEDMGYALQDTDDVIRKLENWIERIEEKGEDPSEMQTILDTFQTNLEAIQAAYDEVSTLIETHPGFDSAGEIIDESLALTTLRSIAEGLLDVHQLGEDAKTALKWDLMIYRYLNTSSK